MYFVLEFNKKHGVERTRGVIALFSTGDAFVLHVPFDRYLDLAEELVRRY